MNAPDLIHTGHPDRVWLWDRECGAIDPGDFARMPAFRADAQALPNAGKLYCIEDTERASEFLPLVRAMIDGYPITEPAIILRIFNHDWSCFGGVVLHRVSEDDAELLVFASPGLCWTRTTLRGLSRWIFHKLGFRRITLRIRGNDLRVRYLARRLGFRHEGIARSAFADGVDASLWGMTRNNCKWLYVQETITRDR